MEEVLKANVTSFAEGQANPISNATNNSRVNLSRVRDKHPGVDRNTEFGSLSVYYIYTYIYMFFSPKKQ